MITCDFLKSRHGVRVQIKVESEDCVIEQLGFKPTHKKGLGRLTGKQLIRDEAIDISITY